MRTETRAGRFDVLLVEDSRAEARLFCEALSAVADINACHNVRDGVEALSFLRRERPYEKAPRPDLVILDLNLPRMNGHELLEAIRNDTALQGIPTLVMSNSSAESDIERAYRAGSHGYVTKPGDFTALLDLTRSIARYWLELNRTPHRKAI
ncbi:response regulator [Lentisalinibacter salinarum]|uniref:response regulator n=1 Tax=Lentisalinibacter salinarum TaxID=2992239 RepID=UPI003870C61B